MSSRKRKCFKGKPCSATCIQRSKVCRVELAAGPQNLIKKAHDYIKANSKTLADHVGKGAAAWKTGKVLGTAISSYLENRYGIPRETSIKLAETAVQGIMATALDFKHLGNSRDLARKLTTEIAAAFIGKTSHAGMESFLSAKEIESALNTALPILAGKVSGIGTAIAASKVPSPAKLARLIVERSESDILKLKQLIKPNELKFEESTFPIDTLGDITLIALNLSYRHGKVQ